MRQTGRTTKLVSHAIALANSGQPVVLWGRCWNNIDSHLVKLVNISLGMIGVEFNYHRQTRTFYIKKHGKRGFITFASYQDRCNPALLHSVLKSASSFYDNDITDEIREQLNWIENTNGNSMDKAIRSGSKPTKED